MATQHYFPPVMNGGLVVRSGFNCKCGKTTCDGCINRENHLRSRNKEQRLIDEANAQILAESQPEQPIVTEPEPIKEEPAKKPAAKRTRRTKKGTA